MKTRILITSGVVLLIIGIYLLFQNKFETPSYKTNIKNNLQSEWKSSKSVSRINDSNEIIEYKKVDVIVVLNEKIIGDTTAIDPLVIDLSKDNIVIKSGLFSKSCNVKFEKIIQQKFKASTDLTTINTEIKGEIRYNIDYEIEGVCKYEKAEQMITDRIMNDIYKHAKERVEFGLPTILAHNFQIETPSKVIRIKKSEL